MNWKKTYNFILIIVIWTVVVGHSKYRPQEISLQMTLCSLFLAQSMYIFLGEGLNGK